MARDRFLLKRKGHFSLVFCPRSFWAGGGINADEVLQKLFSGESLPAVRQGFCKTSADSFLNSDVASGGGGLRP